MVMILSETLNQVRNSLIRKIEPGIMGGKLRRSAVVAKLPKLRAGDSICLLSLPIEGYLHSLKIAADNLGRTGACDIGFSYNNTVAGDALTTGIMLNGRALPLTEIRFSKLPIDTVNSKNWQLTGAVNRPEGATIDVIATVTQDIDVPGSMIAIAEYAVE
jgi:hypothetical protein